MSKQSRILAFATAVLLISASLAACSSPFRSQPTTIPVSDERVKQYLAGPSLDRARFGLESVPTTGDVSIVPEFDYVRLEFNRPNLLKTVFVESTDDGYRWFAEEDTHWGPLTYDNQSSGTEREQVYVVYSLHNSEGGPSKGNYVSYSGPRKDFLTTDPDGLPLTKVAPLLQQWRNQSR